MIKNCAICGSEDFEQVYRGQSPTLVLASLAQAENRPFEEINIVSCKNCRHIFNSAFSVDLLDQLYGDVPMVGISVDPSMDARFNELLVWLDVDQLRGCNALEIGAGNGNFARQVAAFAEEMVIYEPCTKMVKSMLPEANITLIPERFPKENVEVGCYDFVFCRHVLEHIPTPDEFLAKIAVTMRPKAKLYIEVPAQDYITSFAAFQDIHLQHIHYFSKAGLVRLASRYGLRPLRYLDIKDGHDFGILFVLETDSYECSEFANALGKKIVVVKQRLAEIPGNIAFYGATHQGQVFLNSLEGVRDIVCIFDDNPANLGYYFYDKRQKIPVMQPSPDNLQGIGTIIITAYIHEEAIAAKLRVLGFKGKILSTSPKDTEKTLGT